MWVWQRWQKLAAQVESKASLHLAKNTPFVVLTNAAAGRYLSGLSLWPCTRERWQQAKGRTLVRRSSEAAPNLPIRYGLEPMRCQKARRLAQAERFA